MNTGLWIIISGVVIFLLLLFYCIFAIWHEKRMKNYYNEIIQKAAKASRFDKKAEKE